MRKGTHHTETTKQKISRAHLGKFLSREHKRKISKAHRGKRLGKDNPFYGRKHTIESKKKMSSSQTGRKHSDETKRKISEAQIGPKNHMFGKTFKHSAETRKKMSEALTGEKNPMFGKDFSEEHRRKISEAERGDKHWHWMGGNEDYRGLDWGEQRRYAQQRDNYTCQSCGLNENGRKNDTHHWIPYRICRNHNLGNLITLCQKCHKYIEYNFVIDFPEEGFRW